MMSRYPALSHSALRGMYLRNPSPEVRALLWEVARLHGRLLEIDAFLRRLPRQAGQTLDYPLDQLLADLLVVLGEEPAVRRARLLHERAQRQRARQSAPTLGAALWPALVGPPWPYVLHKVAPAGRKSRRS